MYFGNNWTGWQILRWLQEQHEEIVGIAIHPENRRKYGKEMMDVAHVDTSCIFDGSKLQQPEIVEAIKSLRPDIGISVFFGYILRPDILSIMPRGCINVHPAFLPYNRGSHPNVWSIMEGTPAGATIHYVDDGIDTGDIIKQQEVPVEPTDTGQTLYRKLERACVELFIETWPSIRSGHELRMSQQLEDGTFHRAREIEAIDSIDLDRAYTGRELINIVRARTFPPYSGAYFEHEGRKVFLTLQLREEETTEDS
jgi:methionyl-tRNA formyltransferase